MDSSSEPFGFWIVTRPSVTAPQVTRKCLSPAGNVDRPSLDLIDFYVALENKASQSCPSIGIQR
jgi:hypothetical protein